MLSPGGPCPLTGVVKVTYGAGVCVGGAGVIAFSRASTPTAPVTPATPVVAVAPIDEE